MTIYIFGNADHPEDSRALSLIPKLQEDFPKIKFLPLSPGEDLPPSKTLVILDTVRGVSSPRLLTEKDISRLSLSPRNTLHDYDLALQLKLKLKLKLLKKLTLIAIPTDKSTDYSSLQSIVKKLVAQDIHGS